MRSSLQAFFLLAVFAIPLPLAASDDMSRFFGYWAPIDEPFWCKISKQEWNVEGAQMIIGQNQISFGFTGKCEDVGQWMDGDRLRISAACRSEVGAYNVNGEFWFERNGTLFYKLSAGVGNGGRGFRRCANF